MDHLISRNGIAAGIGSRVAGYHVSARSAEGMLQGDFGVEQMGKLHDRNEHGEKQEKGKGQLNDGLTTTRLQESREIEEGYVSSKVFSGYFHETFPNSVKRI